jgi:hypothetical protein
MAEETRGSTFYPDLVCRELKEKSFSFSATETRHGRKLTIPLPAENAKELKAFLYVNPEGDCRIRIYLPCSISREKISLLAPAVNELNSQYRFVNVYVDGDGDICVRYDFLLTGTDAELGMHVLKILILVGDIADECIPVVRDAIREADREKAAEEEFTVKTNLFQED